MGVVGLPAKSALRLASEVAVGVPTGACELCVGSVAADPTVVTIECVLYASSAGMEKVVGALTGDFVIVVGSAQKMALGVAVGARTIVYDLVAGSAQKMALGAAVGARTIVCGAHAKSAQMMVPGVALDACMVLCRERAEIAILVATFVKVLQVEYIQG